MSTYKHIFFPEVPPEQWNDYHWQYRHSLRSLDDISKRINLTEDEISFLSNNDKHKFPFLITPYYFSLINPDNPLDPIRKTVVPSYKEFIFTSDEYIDPLGEEKLSPVPGLVHRYPDRVLFLVTAFCSTYCRYCTRSRMVGNFTEYKFPKEKWDRAIDYIKKNEQVRDVLISGGDPLTLPNSHLKYLVQELSKIKHISLIRLGSKIPVVLPQRVDQELIKILSSYKPVWLSLHFTHSNELRPEVKDICLKLSKAGVPLLSQTVLLKGINDDASILKDLFYGLLSMNVKPYYLLHCDLIKGSSHFRTLIADDLKIMEALQGHISGYAVPKYVIDLPEGKGKVTPNKLDIMSSKNEDGFLYLRNYLNENVRVPK